MFSFTYLNRTNRPHFLVVTEKGVRIYRTKLGPFQWRRATQYAKAVFTVAPLSSFNCPEGVVI